MKILPVLACVLAVSLAGTVPYYGGVSHKSKAQLGHDLGISNVRQNIHPFAGNDYGHNFGLAGNLFGKTVDGKHGPATGKNLHLLGLGHTHYGLGDKGLNKQGFGPQVAGQYGFSNQIGKGNYGLGAFGENNKFGHFTNGKTKVVYGGPVHSLSVGNRGNGYTGTVNQYNGGPTRYHGTGHTGNPYQGSNVNPHINFGNRNGYNGVGHIGNDFNVHVAPNGNGKNPVGKFYGAVKKIDPTDTGYSGSTGYIGTNGKVFDGLLGNVGSHGPSLPQGGHKNAGLGGLVHKNSYDLFKNYGTGSAGDNFGTKGEDTFHNLGLGLQSGSGQLNILNVPFNGFNVKG